MSLEPTPAVEVALAGMKGELETLRTFMDGKLETLNAKLDAGDRESSHLYALLGEQLGYFREALDEVKKTLQEDRATARAESTAVRTALEEQLEGLTRDLIEHIRASNPHPNYADVIALDARMTVIETARAAEDGATEARKPFTAFVWTVAAAVAASGLTSLLFVVAGSH